MVKLIFFLISAASGAAEGDLAERLHVDAQAAVVEIDPIPNNRQLIRLPMLQFPLALEPVCGATARVESISVSAADTRQTFGADDIGKQAIINATLSIPNKQLGPVRIGDFCRSAVTDAVAARELIIQGVLTAHLSLRCSSDEEHSITYVSLPLDIILRCKRLDGATAIDSLENQESSAESEPRL